MSDTNTYFISFTLHSGPDYSDRYNDLIESLQFIATGKWWDETTSFVLLETDERMASVVDAVKNNIDLSEDVALIGRVGFKDWSIVGANKDEDAFALVPFLKKR